ncbi:DNA replication ATP-dependent helicase/nuclease DNA2 [Aricia agestis]|uniref:DNA replication ATP-dependent helicase/nuclease DNA2 n=1 Tax=Aricia agestis TaxID=91739 RepID=UPI001C20A4C1|nr:DNA replication ATP-dependent helicase/nuclease DNA2 [Aricia agestis]
MPKALSLKKNGVKNQNQKPITQFFKNAPQEEKVLSPKKQQSESREQNLNKRKVLSPTTCTINENIDSAEDLAFENVSKKPKVFKNGGTIANSSSSKEICPGGPKSPTKTCSSGRIQNSGNCAKEKVVEHQSGTHGVNKENHVVNQTNGCKNFENGCRKSMSPKKSPAAVTSRSPVKNKKDIIQNCNNHENLALENDIFEEEFEIDGLEEFGIENLDLTKIQRCEILSLIQHPNKIELKLKNGVNERGTCFIEGLWMGTPLQVGEVVSVIASRDANGQFTVGNSSGLLVLRPDHLISSTSVVAGVYCRRKAVLQERWRGIDSANTAMTIGTIIHELVQKALTQHITSLKDLQKEATSIIKDSIHLLYDAGLSEKEALENMQLYLAPLAEFMKTYVEGSSIQHNSKDKWPGKIEQVLDIEENVCCHQLGLKGKIDATLQVTIHDRKGTRQERVPLELKSGRASGSAEHRGQLVLYGMMLALQRGDHPATDDHAALLLYLKERVDLREVRCGYPERRDLIMLRNDLAQHLAPGPNDVDAEKLPDIEDAPRHFKQSLPEPIYNERACTSCPYLTLCSIHLWHTEEPKVSESHPLSKLKSEALGHLSMDHIKYFLHWTSLLLIEERAQKSSMPLHALWTESVEKRSKKGVCAANLTLKSVSNIDGRYMHVFLREKRNSDTARSKSTKGPQEGEYSIVSIDNRPWIAAGVITTANDTEIRILLDRDLSRRLDKSTLFHIDMYESYSTTVTNLTNIGVLMEDSDRALRLRKIIIDREPAVFSEKLPRSVGRLGVRLMRRLNVQQQRAVLRVAAAQSHVLLSGLPGTGKTQTISVLMQLLVALGQRVLVTAHAHAAVDNVLERLPATVRVMRLGAASRVSPSVQARSEHALTTHCETPEQLQAVYDAMEVVGVTCLGAAHSMLARSTFDVCIVDEATQVLQCTALRALCAAARFVLVGDPHQLPPVVRASLARRLGMEESLFHRVMSEHNTSTLRLQYRMNERLARLANVVAYDNQLQCADSTVANATMDLDVKKLPNFTSEEEWLKIACSLEPHDAAVFFDMNMKTDQNSGDKALSNPYEACVIIALTETLIRGGVKPTDIGVIAPYREQVSLLRRCLNAYAWCDAHASSDARAVPEVSTVDQFQGRDKSVIIYSGTKQVDDNIDKKVKEGEVLNDQRRLAVTVTRAKHKLLFVGCSRALQRYAPLARFMEACDRTTLQQQNIEHMFDKYKHFVT